ncbi:MAG TPA: zinc-ribbon and DUF3426 domain-containing protein [Burkholderiales bacterium]|nr:zinc-ribbon and DUF3426 domain-containing protein [Burkholderiales bacterium]
MMHRVICPGCTTVFRVTSTQMNMRAGQLRCGRCQEVFNGWHHLEDPPSESLSNQYPRIPEADPLLEYPGTNLAAPEERQVLQPESSNNALPEILRPVQPSRYWQSFWILLTLSTFLLLVMQGILFWRTTLNVDFPRLRPVLTLISAMDGARLELPRDASLISLDSSELHSDPQPGIYTLDAIIVNRAPFPEQYPLMELSLTDVHNSIIARRVLSPSVYLGPKGRPSEGIAAHSEVDIHVPLKISNVEANGYHVYIFYAARPK